MERSVNNNALIMSKHETTTFSSDQTQEESSWSMYFEDFFEASTSVVDVGDCSSSSSVPDAASYVATNKTLHVSKQEGTNYSKNLDIKRTRNREIPFGRHHDLEDTASSPSHSPNVYRHGAALVGDDKINEKGEIAVKNKGGLSVELEKRGLCLVPLSLVTNFLG